MGQSNSTYISNRTHRAALSKHARVRAQQRGISQDDVKLITAFGERSHDNQGGIRCLMTEQAVQGLIRALGFTQKIESLRGAYVVLSAQDESTVITVAHRYN